MLLNRKSKTLKELQRDTRTISQRRKQTKYRKEKDLSVLIPELENSDNKIIVITGGNGSGKSHTKKLLTCNSPISKEYNLFQKYYKRDVYSYDSEKDNLRTKSNATIRDDQWIPQVLRIVNFSHGQAIFKDLEEILSVKNSNIFLDEPESGIDLDNLIKLKDLLIESAKHNKIYLFTNSPLLTLLANEIYEVKKTKVSKVKSVKAFKNRTRKHLEQLINQFTNI